MPPQLIEPQISTRPISLKINGKDYNADLSKYPPSTTLVDFIRNEAHLTGTKVLCREAGCGICTVVARCIDPETNNPKVFCVRSCHTLLYSCVGWSIETIEHLGDRYKGYHKLQQALHKFYGTQCGYCSPGFIMTMYGELESKGSFTTNDVEKNLDGNICRCTGYRPIIEAFKSLASDAPPQLKEQLQDIEDFDATCPKTGKACKGSCGEEDSCSKTIPKLPSPSDDLKLLFSTSTWYRPETLEFTYGIIKESKPEDKILFVVGNTGSGVYKKDGPYNIFINTSGVQEFHKVNQGTSLVLGCNVTLTRAMEAFKTAAKSNSGFNHLEQLVKHWQYVANVAVRNVGSWAGNLMLKHRHPEFPSDIFLTLLAVDASIEIGNAENKTSTHMNLLEFMKEDMKKKIILSISIPKQRENTIIKTYKITPRAVNAHAYVNAAFKFRVDPNDNFKLVEKPTILFGGINDNFVHAAETESYLASVKLYNRGVMSKAVSILGKEINPKENYVDVTAEYRRALAQGLFYKTVVMILGDKKVSPEYVTAGTDLERGPSSSVQSFDENKDTWPVGQPIPKLESKVQISGEGEYVDDMESLHNELHGVFVQTKVANATIVSVDTFEALEIPGVQYIQATDLKGANSFIAQAARFPDPIFATDRSIYAGQPVGLILAPSRSIAKIAAELVKIEYKDAKPPVLTIREALKTAPPTPPENIIKFGDDLDVAMKTAKHTIEGDFDQGTQFHFPMEALCSRVIPTEDGYDVYATTQWPTEAQACVAQVLKISSNSVNVNVRRIGGAYGSKITRGHLPLCAAAVAADKLKRPVRVTLDLNSHMTLVGWREPYLSQYKVGFDDEGKLQFCDIVFVGDAGHVSNESAAQVAIGILSNCYVSNAWKIESKIVNTDTAANTYCRTPGHVEALATIENIIEHIAQYLNKDPMEIRQINFVPDGGAKNFVPTPKGPNLIKSKLLPLLSDKASIDARKKDIKAFNQNNRWKKRGLSVIPMFYGFNYPSIFYYSTHVAINAFDGTVSICHGGVEMGQGINVKAAQVAAQVLGISMDKIRVKPTNTFVGANSVVTGGSFGTDLVCFGVKWCCEKIKERILEVLSKQEKKPEWKELIALCGMQNVDLSERFFSKPNERPKGYDIWGLICTEIEMDVITGQFIIKRTDIVEDCGRSLNPYVDVGQIEGSVIMGFGLYTTELVKFNPDTGEKLSNGTWEYKPPTALDIPVDFRVTILPNGNNTSGVVGSKATGEPALCLSYSVVTALRQAITSARKDAGLNDWFEMDTPLTVEKIQTLCKVDPKSFLLKKKDKDDLIDTSMDSEHENSKSEMHDSKNCSLA